MNDWDADDRQAFVIAAGFDAKTEYDAFCNKLESEECGFASPTDLYLATHGTTVLTMSSGGGAYCERSSNPGQQGVTCYAGMRGKVDKVLAAHELAHVFNALIANNGQAQPYNDLATERATNPDFPAIGVDITSGYNSNKAQNDGEDFANMFSMNVFGAWPGTPGGGQRQIFMATNMAIWIGRSLRR